MGNYFASYISILFLPTRSFKSPNIDCLNIDCIS